MDTSLIMIFFMVGVFLFGVIAYMVILFFWPEWVGVHGKKAQEVEAQHLADSSSSNLTAQQEKPNE